MSFEPDENRSIKDWFFKNWLFLFEIFYKKKMFIGSVFCLTHLFQQPMDFTGTEQHASWTKDNMLKKGGKILHIEVTWLNAPHFSSTFLLLCIYRNALYTDCSVNSTFQTIAMLSI